eukprot:4169755-Prymnesium_polylepis.1
MQCLSPEALHRHCLALGTARHCIGTGPRHCEALHRHCLAVPRHCEALPRHCQALPRHCETWPRRRLVPSSVWH